MDIPDMANDNYPNTEYDDDGLMASNTDQEDKDIKFERNDQNSKGYSKQSTANSNKNGLGLAVTGIPMS